MEELIIRYRFRNNELQIHTGGPLNEFYWTIAPYETIESTKKYFEQINKDFKIKMKLTK